MRESTLAAPVGRLGWATVCFRVLGIALGQAQDFRRPMAKPHRMALPTRRVVSVSQGWRESPPNQRKLSKSPQ